MSENEKIVPALERQLAQANEQVQRSYTDKLCNTHQFGLVCGMRDGVEKALETVRSMVGNAPLGQGE